MTNEVKDFIEENIKLIEDEKFEELYTLLYYKQSELRPSEFTEILLDAGIDPATHMKKIPVFYLYESDIQSYVIPNTIDSIGTWAFARCSSLTNMTIPNDVTSIGDSAFSGCTSLKSVTIPNSVTSIGREAFYGCGSLENITIPDSVTSIGNNAFSGCSSLTSIMIPDGVTSIKRGAFSFCSSLMNITIPNTITEIGVEAFSSCTNLESIDYLGTKDQWNKIKLGRQWKTSSRRLKEIKCTDGTIIP